MKKWYKCCPAIIILVIIVHLDIECGADKDNREICLSQGANSSRGSYWEYEFSNTNVLQEKDYFTRQYIGPGYRQKWIFEVKDAGEVTIFWKEYISGGSSEGESYSVTYFFDEEGKYTVVSDSRAEAKKNAKEIMRVFVKKDREQLLELFCEDIQENHREKTIGQIEEAFSFIDGKITQYDYEKNLSSIYQRWRDNCIYLWRDCSRFQIDTENNKKYTVILYYIRRMDEQLQYQGLDGIVIVNDKGEKVRIGEKFVRFPKDEEDENPPTPEPTPTPTPTHVPGPYEG